MTPRSSDLVGGPTGTDFDACVTFRPQATGWVARVLPCQWTACAETPQEVLSLAAEHLSATHKGLKWFAYWDGEP